MTEPDHWIPREEVLIKLTGQHPFNANPPLSIDETLPHYVRNHADVPKLDKDHPL
jgi:nitrate reductase (NAD(P)H)